MASGQYALPSDWLEHEDALGSSELHADSSRAATAVALAPNILSVV
jgi:hypothetical protein